MSTGVPVCLKKVYWRIVVLQCCVGFYHTAIWISYAYVCVYIYTHTHIYLLLFGFPSHWGHCGAFPVLYSRFSLVIYFIHSINSVYLSIPISQFISPPPLSPLVQFSHSVVSSSLRPHGLQHARPPCPSPTPRACFHLLLFNSSRPEGVCDIPTEGDGRHRLQLTGHAFKASLLLCDPA